MELNFNECNLLAQSGLGNIFHDVCLHECDGQNYMTLSTNNGMLSIAVSEQFADAFIKEFKE